MGPWARGPVPRPKPGLGFGSQDPESVARWAHSVCWRGPEGPWARTSSPAWLRFGVPGSRIGGPVGPFGVLAWARGPVGPGPVPRPQPGLGLGSQDPESVARWVRSVCPRGPVGPWARGAWPRASSPAWLRFGVSGSRIGGPVGPFGVAAWTRWPVRPSGPRLHSHSHAD